MKKWWTWVFVPVLLTGCAAEPVFETVEDSWMEPVLAPEARQIQVALPENTAVPVLQQEDGSRVYLTEDFEIRVETVPSGDLNGTLLALTGREKDSLTLLTTQQEELTRYDCAWVTTGEEAQQVAHTAVLDDGDYHYCLTVLWNADQTESLQQEVGKVFSGFSLM